MKDDSRSAGKGGLLCSCANDGVLSVFKGGCPPRLLNAHVGSGSSLASGDLLSQGYDGAILAALKLPAMVFSSPACFNGMAIFGCRDNFLYCFTCG